jgi:drug/metabolite transporter (DMT)-like permease
MKKFQTNKKIFGTICGIGAAICYGTNPIGAQLYKDGMEPPSVLFWRFGLAWVIILLIMLARKESLRINRKEFGAVSALGLLFLASSLTLYESFKLMSVGVASTILFVYPVITAAIMTLIFKERLTLMTSLSIILSFIGVMMLYWTPGGSTLDTLGVILVLVSAITYAIYIIVMNRSNLKMSSFKINFYVLIYCAFGNLIIAIIDDGCLQIPHSATNWLLVGWLAVVPAILALVMMVYSAKYIGSTPTAIMGALEPLTAVLIGIFLFGESFNARLAIGIALIFWAVIIIALQSNKKNNNSLQKEQP